MAHHLWQHDAPQHQHTRHRKGQPRFCLAAGHGQNGTTESLGQVGTKDEADGEHAGPKGRHIDVVPTLGFCERVDADLPTVKDQQHQHQLGHAADQGGVDVSTPTCGARSRQLGHCTYQPEHTGDGQGQDGDAQRQAQAFKNGRKISVEHKTT